MYNLLGQKVAQLVNEVRTQGRHTVQWDATAHSSGVYFYQLSVADNVLTKTTGARFAVTVSVADNVLTKKMLLIK